ncbi:MAG TPA: hypothetical protein EYP80_02425 [Candidatus Aenigmarchaeota archaeon]|nr:hypothetical protein [Candidatus Aenigmarchaeota archaeon]
MEPQRHKIPSYLIDVKEYFENFSRIKHLLSLSVCKYCGGEALIGWGYYERYAQIDNLCQLVKIRRFKCKSCGKTSSLLPYFLLPRITFGTHQISGAIHSYLFSKKSLARVAEEYLGEKEKQRALFRHIKYLKERAERLRRRLYLFTHPSYEEARSKLPLTPVKRDKRTDRSKLVKIAGVVSLLSVLSFLLFDTALIFYRLAMELI